MSNGNEIRVDAATNLAAFVLNGEVVARASVTWQPDGSKTMLLIESSIPVQVNAESVSAIHVQTD